MRVCSNCWMPIFDSLMPSQDQHRQLEASSGNAFSRFLQLIRFSHTIFALPFALGALVVAANGLPSARTLLLVLVCMVSARTAAMLFNRFVDWSLDQRNPRTASRHLLLSKPAIGALLGLSSALFVAAAAAINRLTFVLSPVALAISPIGAWIAQRGDLDLAPIVLAIGVICWVAGFDLIYATQDFEFDRREGIRSLVVAMGIARTLRVARLLHVLMLTMLIGFGFAANLGPIYFLAMPVVAAALVYEHRSARSLDVAGINRAFFQSNAFVGALFLVVVCLDRLI